jgi:hypothetical protein
MALFAGKYHQQLSSETEKQRLFLIGTAPALISALARWSDQPRQ